MAASLKAFFDARRMERLADEFAAAWSDFPRAAFVADATRGLADLELMDRARHVARALGRALPAEYPEALAIVLRALGPPLPTEGNGMEGFHHHPHAVFIEERGLDHPALSLAAMREVTKRASCEFAIRPYLVRHEATTLATLRAWTRDPDPHVRRLVSEGTRPRLPWAARLSQFVTDPTPTLALLADLKDDPSEYVRRSVANHLNDVSKDHPDLVVETCARWLDGASPERRKLVARALRSLVRADHPGAIGLLGGAPVRLDVEATIEPKRPRIGENVRIAIALANRGRAEARAVLALRIHFVKANGATSPKTFRLPAARIPPRGAATSRKTVSLAQHSTRRHHPGVHVVEVVVNGEARRVGEFRLGA